MLLLSFCTVTRNHVSDQNLRRAVAGVSCWLFLGIAEVDVFEVTCKRGE